MRNVERTLVQIMCIQAGIVPLDEPYKGVAPAFVKMPEAEATKMKRKFRKLWRKVLKEKTAKATQKNRTRYESAVGNGRGCDPRPWQKTRRKTIVLASMLDKIESLISSMPTPR